MRIIDISARIEENMSVYDGDPPVKLEAWTSFEQQGYAVTRLSLGTHTGTHIDAPSHYLADGAAADGIALDTFFGECEVTNDPTGSKSDRMIMLEARELTPEEAEKLANRGVRLIGTGLETIGSDEVHRILLGSGCVILENLRLEGVETKKYFLACAPLKLAADASPVRACLIEGIKEI